MPRRARNYVSGLPYHIVQRGNNRQACFFEIPDYQCYLGLLSEVLCRYRVALHAYVLMTNHVHFLMTAASETGISNVMKVAGSRYAYYINRTYGRTGTLWEGRHKSSAVDSETYLLKCYRYIELNPVAAGMVEKPEEYRWSSYHANACGDPVSYVTPHLGYQLLSADPDARCRRYRELFRCHLSEEDIHAIRKSTHYCYPLGSDRFRLQLQKKTGKSPGYMARGRPRDRKVAKK